MNSAIEHPQRIGAYLIRDVLGEGGMAVVYLAEQTEPVHRMVALKILKPGMDTRQVIARFESERQALAVLEHPNIAKVFDAGTTEAGRPFFVMERVRGVPITAYCDERRLTLRERAALFVEACFAIQHAHQKGLIHRDLKPSNILVDDSNEPPVVKVIDFGIAKAVGAQAGDQLEATRLGQLVGTPQYMSPEQAEFSTLDIDTRTDIYSLGVVLYELLSGTLPVDLARVADYAVSVVLREREPPLPSQRIAQLPQAQEIARCRGTDSRSLQRSMRGDLDWIVMKAIAKDRTRRYETANALATDLQRYLGHLPVLARPPSTRYVLGRFVRRNKVAAVAAAVTLAALLVGLTTASVGLVRARAAEQQASAEAESARRVADFMVELFEVSDPGEARGNTITAREVLDQAAVKIDRQLAGQPAVRAKLMSAIGRVYMELGLYADALPLASGALELRRTVQSASTDLADSLDQVGELHTLLSRPLEALPLHEQALAVRQNLAARDDAAESRTLRHIGDAHLRNDQFDASVQVFLQAQRLQRGSDAPRMERGALANQLAQAYHYLDRLGEAEPLYREAEAIYRSELGDDHPRVASTVGDLAILLQDSGRREESAAAHEEALAIRRKALGNGHPLVASTLNNLAMLYMRDRDYAAALPRAQEAVAIVRESLGDRHEETNIIRLNLGRVHARREELAAAESEMRAVLAVRRETLTPGHLEIGITLDALTDVLNRQRRYAEAEPVAREALEIMRNTVGMDHSRAASAEIGLGEALFGLKQYAEAERHLLHAYEVSERGRGGASGALRRSAERLIDLYEARKTPELAAPYRAKLQELLASG